VLSFILNVYGVPLSGPAEKKSPFEAGSIKNCIGKRTSDVEANLIGPPVIDNIARSATQAS